VLKAAVLVFGLLLLLGRGWLSEADSAGAVVGQGEDQVLELFESRRSGDMVLVDGVVDALLTDDNDGSRHQRFIIRLESGHTLLVAHNIDLAPRVPLRVRELVQVRGEYEWNERGGVLHWTHHDPDGAHPGGWIQLDGDRYR
jgi:hypothetical protein